MTTCKIWSETIQVTKTKPFIWNFMTYLTSFFWVPVIFDSTRTTHTFFWELPMTYFFLSENNRFHILHGIYSHGQSSWTWRMSSLCAALGKDKNGFYQFETYQGFWIFGNFIYVSIKLFSLSFLENFSDKLTEVLFIFNYLELWSFLIIKIVSGAIHHNIQWDPNVVLFIFNIHVKRAGNRSAFSIDENWIAARWKREKKEKTFEVQHFKK